MFEGLKKAAGKAFGGEEIDRILSLPITKLRIELKQAWQDKKFNEQQFNDFVERLSKVDDIAAQIDVAKNAVTARAVDSELDIELNSPAKQLLWAAAFARMMDAGGAPLAQSPIWKQMQNTIGVHNEGIAVAKVISASMQNDDVTFDWGQPGSWFYYDPHENHINLDLFFMLQTGFEHIRSVNLHEIGHSELSNVFSPRMKALYDEVKAYIDPRTITDEDRAKNPPRKMKKSEQKELGMKVQEWNLRFQLWHMTEDNCVNQFSANMSNQLPQDFAYSLNYVSAILQGFGERLNGDEKTRKIVISTDRPPPADEKQREIYDKALEQTREERQKAYDAAYKRASTPLSAAEIADAKKGNITPEVAHKVFHEINTAVLLTYYEKNGMFNGANDKTWERFHVFPDEIRQLIDVSTMPDAQGRDAFKYLYDLSGGVKQNDFDVQSLPLNRQQAEIYLQENTAAGRAHAKANAGAPADAAVLNQAALDILRRPKVLGAGADKAVADKGGDAVALLIEQAAHARGTRGLQPQPADRMLVAEPYTTLRDSYQAVVESTAVQRGVMMDAIWDAYLKPYADVLLKEYEKKLEERLNQQQKNGGQQNNQQGNQQSQQQGGQQQGQQGQQQEGQQGQGQQSQGQQQEGQGQQGEQGGQQSGQQGEKGEQQGGGQQGGDPELDMDEDLKKDVGGMAENPGEKRDQENGENGAGGQKNDDKKDPQDKNESGAGKDGEKTQDGDKQKGKDKDGHGGAGWDQDPNAQNGQPKKVGDAKKQESVDENMSEAQKEAMRQNAKSMPKVDPNAMKSDNAGNQSGVDLAKLAKGDWRDFNRRVIELAPVINQVALSYKRIREAQRRQIEQMSRKRDFLPPDGDILDRLNKDQVLEAKFRKATRQKMTPDDFKKFQDDETSTTESTIEITAMIDGSGSMPSVQLGGGVSAMEAALQSAVINYMACRKAGIDSYIVMWGDAEPIIVATPDSNLKDVGKTLETLRNGTGSGTDLAPGIVKTVDAMSKHKNKNGTVSGSSHILVYSDGDIGDFRATVEKLGILSKNAKNLSVDVAVLRAPGANGTTQMEKAFQTVIDNSGGRLVGIVRGNDPQKVPLELSRLMLKRVRSFQVKAEPDSEKRRRLKQLHKKLS